MNVKSYKNKTRTCELINTSLFSKFCNMKL